MRNRQHRKKWSKNYGNLVNSTELLVMTFKAHTSHIGVVFLLRLVSSTCFFHLFQLQNDDCVFSSHILFITSSSLHHICTKRAAFDRVFTFCGNDAWCYSFFLFRDDVSHLLGVTAQRAVKLASAIISRIFHSLFYERCHSADCWLLWWPIQYQMGNYTTLLHIDKKVI